MNKKLGQESAFACESMTDRGDCHIQEGISKRYYTACMAMQGILAADSVSYHGNVNRFVPAAVVNDAYEVADEMLKQELEGMNE